MHDPSELPFPVAGEITEAAWDQVAEGQPVLLPGTAGRGDRRPRELGRSRGLRRGRARPAACVTRVRAGICRRCSRWTMVTEGICACCWRAARLCMGQLELFRHAPSGATTGRSRGRAVRLPDLGTLSAAMPVQLALLSLGAGIVAVALVALIDAVARARRLHRQRALCDLAAFSWPQFEEVIADAFRRHGYQVREVGDRGQADGGSTWCSFRMAGPPWCRRSTGAATGSVSSSSASCTAFSAPCTCSTQC